MLNSFECSQKFRITNTRGIIFFVLSTLKVWDSRSIRMEYFGSLFNNLFLLYGLGKHEDIQSVG